MKKASILLIALMVISVGFLSGCTEQTPTSSHNSPNASWTVTSTGESTVKFNWDCDGQTCLSYGISEVYINLKNTGGERTNFIVDFSFNAKKIQEGIYVWPNNCCNGENPYSTVDSQKQISISPGQTIKVTSTCNPNPTNDEFVYSWQYHVSAE